MSKDIEVSTIHKGDVAIVNIKGDITATTGEVVADACNSDGVAGSKKILLSFGKECYINSGGLAFIIDIASAGRKKGQIIRAAGLSDHFQKIFHMVGLTRCVALFPTDKEAMEGF